MVAKELSLEEQEAGNGESILLQDPYESEETLSLCDLPIHNDSFKWDDDFSKEDGQNSSSNNNDDDEDFFEFFSEDFTVSTRGNTNKSIIFLGKSFTTRSLQSTFLRRKRTLKATAKRIMLSLLQRV
ncbi:hypothetical protein L6164_007265 [Bauhinia variegata]|uniref:Uncharacterized protein n=1 Tax=Bauhinia variegata TaxID=167791 RepID=A0ACB9PC09_BAUVA|nr:hypothetical protein L6164_007265 [Bauhinia variegata]